MIYYDSWLQIGWEADVSADLYLSSLQQLDVFTALLMRFLNGFAV